MKFLGFLRLRCNLRVVTGLHIGGGAAGISIGATDSPVIKVNGKPYIPGSSLKGKIRSLLEIAHGLKIDSKLGRHECEKNTNPCDVCVVFGRAAERKGSEGPTRIIFRDSYINDELSDEEARKSDYTEIKMENAINRITSRVEGALRDTERVLPGTVFDVEVLYRVYDEDFGSGSLASVEKLETLPEPLKTRFGLILEGMKILEQDYLGGKGTRGYGKVQFENIKIESIPLEFFKKNGEIKELFSGSLSEAMSK
ncbi:type III-A CRISPR-associated RAMP protein Csm3 [Archaeoglobales archaeon]|nr:MAG: type III-A CRISPR-associated RAMP protein Csm3 [Archaeoglobales archaeon]